MAVGSGGSGTISCANSGNNGGSTSAFGWVAAGGGYPTGYSDCSGTGGLGGSGGGGCSYGCDGGSSSQVGYSCSNCGTCASGNVCGFGHDGGAGSYPWAAGGGGGAGGAAPDYLMHGGAGLDMSSFFGTDVGDSGWFAGGGGGSQYGKGNGCAGCKGGGGDGSSGYGVAGMQATGGGCGASERGVGQVAGSSGGSGVVIIKYKIQCPLDTCHGY